MGPENYGVNAAVNPRTCNGDWVISVQGFYWNAHQEGLEYGILNDMTADAWEDSDSEDTGGRYIAANAESPTSKWDVGFKIGLGYNTTCDGWDLGLTWTSYRGKASSHIEAEADDNSILIAYLSNTGFGESSYMSLATDASTDWKLKLTLVDFELGREFWNSKRLALRPFIGLRYAQLNQDYNVNYKGGDFYDEDVNDKIDMVNDFDGFGVRAGLNSVWNLGCGWGVYGNLALSMVVGKFNVKVDEITRDTYSPYDETVYTEFENNFKATRLMTDLAIGVQWSALLCECQYGVTVALGWEQHMFLNQNQLFRFNNLYGDESFIDQMRGDLDTEGWTLSVTLDF